MVKHQFLVIISLLLMTSCAANGGSSNPFVRQFQYYSYINGDDIRKACVTGAESRYRLVYNALYEKQVRTYDIRQGFDSDIGEQETRVFSRGIGSEFDVTAEGVDFKSNFHSIEALKLENLIAIDKALITSGFEQPTKNGQILHSDEFYWVAMVCRNGNFKYYAWVQGETDIDKLPFLDVLSDADTTGVKILKFYIPIIHDRGGRPMNSDSSSIGYFRLEVGDNELKL